jgi:hypothetical protein
MFESYSNSQYKQIFKTFSTLEKIFIRYLNGQQKTTSQALVFLCYYITKLHNAGLLNADTQLRSNK